jgi:hypothetical protein
MILGAFSRASLKSSLTSFSLSPSHFDTKSLLLMLKNVLSASVATACNHKANRAQYPACKHAVAFNQTCIHSPCSDYVHAVRIWRTDKKVMMEMLPCRPA